MCFFFSFFLWGDLGSCISGGQLSLSIYSDDWRRYSLPLQYTWYTSRLPSGEPESSSMDSSLGAGVWLSRCICLQPWLCVSRSPCCPEHLCNLPVPVECRGRSSAVLGLCSAVYLTDKGIVDTSVRDKAKIRKPSISLRTMVSFWKLAGLKVILSFVCWTHLLRYAWQGVRA